MRMRSLVVLGVTYYWRTNVAVVLGVATAVAVLAGALLVGDSVRGSLRDLVLQRLGRADHVVSSAGFFREDLADAIAPDLTSGAVCPLIAVEGAVTNQTSGRRVSHVQVYGVDDRFWRFHGLGRTGPVGRRRAGRRGPGRGDRRAGGHFGAGRARAAIRHPDRIAARPQGPGRSPRSNPRARGDYRRGDG